MPVVFETTINLGQIVSSLLILLSGFAVLVSMREQLRSIVTRVAGMETELQQQTTILVSVARQDERLNSFEKRLEGMDK